MNREKFLERLNELLQYIPDAEREEAIEYYREYFDDAGVENEEQVIKELGSPEKVAEHIKSEVAEKMPLSTNIEETRDEQSEKINSNYEYQNNFEENTKSADGHFKNLKNWAKENPVLFVVIAVVCCLVCAPVIVPLAAALLGAVASILAAMCGVLVGLVIAGAAVGIAAIVVLVLAFGLIGVPAAFGVMIGVAVLLAGISILMILAGVKLWMWLFPIIVDGIQKLYNKLFGKKEATE